MIAERLRQIGKLVKLHGFGGEALMIFEEDFSKKITKTEWVFITIDGLPVPFFISKIDVRSDTSAVIKFLEIESADEMKEFIGCDISVIDSGRKTKVKKVALSNITDYRVIDSNLGEIGKAKELLNFNENIVLQVINGDKEVLIPVAEEIIVSIDENKKEIRVNLPEGLLELNL